jgi:hypothetical protein
MSVDDDSVVDVSRASRATVVVRYAPWVLAAILFALAVALFFELAPHTNIIFAALLLLLAVVVVVVRPQQMVLLARTVSRVDLMGVSVEFGRAAENAKTAAGQTSGEENDQDAGSNVENHDLMQLRLKLDEKLAYIAEEILAQPCGDHRHATFVTVGRLRQRRLITDEQALTLSRLQTMSPRDLPLQDAQAVEAFLADASHVVGRLRSTVFRTTVERYLYRNGWRRRRGGHRLPGLVSRWERTDDAIVVRPVFVVGESAADVVARRRTQLAKTPAGAGRRFIVVPERSSISASDATDDPAVVRLGQFHHITGRDPGAV